MSFNGDDNGHGCHGISIDRLFRPNDEDGRQRAATFGRDEITADDVMETVHYRRLDRRL